MNITWQKLSERSEKVGYRVILHKLFRLPDKTEVDMTVIDSRRGAAGVFAITKQGKIIVARQYRPGQEQIMDEIPGGAIDQGEEPIEAARRELREETGYEGKLEHIVTIPKDAYTDGLWHYFIARDCEKVDDVPQNSEHEFIEIAEISLEQLMNLPKLTLGVSPVSE